MKAQSTGFTLLELMFTLAVLAVLVGIGIPNFRDFMRNSRMSAAANDIITDFSVARSEAVKRRVPVTICKSQDGAACDADDADPFTRWIMFVDDADAALAAGTDGDGEVDAGEAILRDRQISTELTVTTNADGVRVVFMPTGFPSTTAADRVTDFTLCDERGNVVAAGGDSAARLVQIRATGRPNVTRDIDTITANGDCP